MIRFRYKARSKEGKIQSGQVESRDINQAAIVLREQELVIIELKPVKAVANFAFLTSVLQRIKFVDLVNFTRQLSTMINAGLPLTESLALLEQQVTPALQKIVTDVLQEVEAGKTLGEALAKHPKAFSSVYVSLIKAGESAGKIDEMLLRLADNLEKEREFRSKTRGAMVYPLIVVVGMIIVAGIMMIFVVPKLTDLYEDFGAELPFSTRILVAASNFVSDFWYFAIIGAILLSWMFRAWISTPVGRRIWDDFVFRIPIYGELRKKILLSDFCRTLGLLVGAGVSIVEGLNIVADIMENVVYSNSIKEVAKKVEKGISVASAIGSYSHFPAILSQMLTVGEETGKVDEVLLKIAVYFETEAEHLVKGLTTAIEPLIMVVLGVGVGFLVISIILPIYNLTSQL